MKILGISKELKNEELPAFSELKNETYDFFINASGNQNLFENVAIPVDGFISTYFGINYLKGGIFSIFNKGLAGRENSEAEMKLKIDFNNKKWTNYIPDYHYITLHCECCSSLFDLPMEIMATGKYDHIMCSRDGQRIEYVLFLNFVSNLNLDENTCSEKMNWNHVSGNMYWLDKPLLGTSNLESRSNPIKNFYLKKIEFE